MTLTPVQQDHDPTIQLQYVRVVIVLPVRGLSYRRATSVAGDWQTGMRVPSTFVCACCSSCTAKADDCQSCLPGVAQPCGLGPECIGGCLIPCAVGCMTTQAESACF